MEDLILSAKKRLEILGIYTDDIGDILEYYVNLATVKLNSILGTNSLPTGTENILSDMVAGMYLKDILLRDDKSVSAVKSLSEGEISVAYQGGKSLWDIANEMATPSEYVLSAFRCIRW